MNLREQFDRDQKGHTSFQEYCRENVDKRSETLTFASPQEYWWHIEMYAKHPLGCESFGAEWLELWASLGELLGMPGELQCQAHVSRHWWLMRSDNVGRLLALGAPVNTHLNRRIALLDGTIVKEWGAT